MPSTPLLALALTLLVQEPVLDPRLEAAVTLDGEHPFCVPKRKDEWERRAAELRRRLQVAAGLWPFPERTPLNVRVTGRIERDDYTLERIAFESLPGHVVTANLYRPKGAGPFAGVLSPHGHWDRGRLCERAEQEVAAELASGGEWRAANARYHLQARCATLARLGCVVLQHDMVGYADSRALPHGAGFEDAEAMLRGQSAFGLQTWNSIRALDLLAELPEVDPTRIAVTGASGGGTQTFVLCALDPRPAACAPAVMVSTTMQGGCVCENAPHLRIGAGNVELAALAAPRPLALTGANDWTVAIEERGLPELRELYGLLGVPERVDGWVHSEFGHNYNAISRAHVYGFLDRHLALGAQLGEHPLRAAALEARFEPVPPAQLSVWADEGAPEQLDARALRALWTARQEARLAALQPTDAASLEGWRESIDGALVVLIPARLPSPGEVALEVLGEELRADGVRRRALRLTGPGALVHVVEWRPVAEPRGVVLWIDGYRDAARLEEHPARAVLERGFVLACVDTLLEPLAGEPDGALPVDAGRHGSYAGYTWGYNEVLLAQRVRDVLIAARHARDELGSEAPLALFGSGWAGPGALLAAARAPEVFARVAVRWDWDFEEIASLADPRLLPGALAAGGMAGLGSLFAPGELTLVGGVAPPERLAAAWHAAGAAQHLRSATDEAEAAAWLAELHR